MVALLAYLFPAILIALITVIIAAPIPIDCAARAELVDRLRHEDVDHVMLAVRGLGDLGDTSVIPALVDRLEDESLLRDRYGRLRSRGRTYRCRWQPERDPVPGATTQMRAVVF